MRCVHALILVVLASAVLAGCDRPESSTDLQLHRTRSATHDLQLAVRGMSCEHCENAIVQTVTRLDGVAACEANAVEGRAVVSVSDEASAEAIIEAITALGYEVEKLD